MKGILSYALFRAPAPTYWRSDATEDRVSAYARFLPVLVRVHHAIWPGYELRIHHDEQARKHPYFEALVRLHVAGLVRLVPCGSCAALTLSMLWRMRPLFEPDDHLVVTCDLDALPMLKLRRAVEAFARSERAVMLVHGCESHNGVLGGGIGARAQRFRQLVRAASWEAFTGRGAGNWAAYAADEEFLRTVIWPQVAGEAIVFRDTSAPLNIACPDVRPFPTGEVPSDLVPEVVAHGNDFAPYPGSAGYDVSGAFHFYQGLPLPVMQTIRQCEGESLDLRQVMRL